jgi:hypothetical protein
MDKTCGFRVSSIMAGSAQLAHEMAVYVYTLAWAIVSVAFSDAAPETLKWPGGRSLKTQNPVLFSETGFQ